MLNRSIVDIERGDLTRARQQLTPITALAMQEHGVPVSIAEGYLGLISHIEGDYETAEKVYSRAIVALQKFDRSRAVSIFCRHYGDLLRELRATPDEADRMLASALRYAQEGSHEDQRYLAILSTVRLRLKTENISTIRDVQKDLAAAERYARAVDMPRLLSEIAECRGMQYQKLGDSRLAAVSASACVEISSLHDLRLRKINGMLLLAEIFIARGRPQDAAPLVTLAGEMAKGIRYYAAQLDVARLQQDILRVSPT